MLNTKLSHTWPSACIKKEASLRTALQNVCGGQVPCKTVDTATLDWVVKSSLHGSPTIMRKHICVVVLKRKTIFVVYIYSKRCAACDSQKSCYAASAIFTSTLLLICRIINPLQPICIRHYLRDSTTLYNDFRMGIIVFCILLLMQPNPSCRYIPVAQY